jgi:uncharacterized membrane protein YccC
MRAVRAAVVIPILFALAFKVIGNLQVALFVGFGGFATLVLAGFSGTRRQKLIAHAGLAVTGSVLLTIGTAVSSPVAVAAAVTVPVTFLVFFAGVVGPNAGSGVTAALLAYVLPAASPGTMAMVPDRLAGWWLASVAGTAAVLALSPAAAGNRLREATVRVTRALADEIDAVLAGETTDVLLNACIDAKHELLARFTATPFRPTGLAPADQALANAVELLEWCTALVTDMVRERSDLRGAAPADRELLDVTAAVLREAGRLFGGGEGLPDLERLDECRARGVARLGQLKPDSPNFATETEVSFHANALAVTVLAIGADALVAAGVVDADWIAEAGRRWFVAGSTRVPDSARRLSRVSRVAEGNATVRSVWLINSLRGSIALAVAVAVADLSSVQHGFWVVLGALSVLRTNAASTGSTALRALLGTAAGFAIGGALVVAIGSSATALWVALPIAALVAAYAPGTAPFAVGQAAFTVFIVVLFNLLAPVGWKVGVVRIEDVGLGCAVSLLVGSLFWPRGVAAVVGDDLADAYRTGATYLRGALEWVSGSRRAEPDQAMAVVTAGVRLDHALRAFLSEQGTKHIAKQELWRLVGGTQRLRLTAHAVAQLPPDVSEDSAGMRAALGQRAATLEAWYERLASLLGRPRPGPATELAAPAFDGPGVEGTPRSPQLIWLSEHLDHLTEHLAELVQPAARVAEIRRRPWWR